MEMARGKRGPSFCALWKRVLRALVAGPADFDGEIGEEDRRGVYGSWFEFHDQEYGVPPRRPGGW